MKKFVRVLLFAAAATTAQITWAADASRDAVSLERLSSDADLLRKEVGLLRTRQAATDETVGAMSAQIGKVDDASRKDMEALRAAVQSDLREAKRYADEASAQRAEMARLADQMRAMSARVDGFAALADRIDLNEKSIEQVSAKAGAATARADLLDKQFGAVTAGVEQLEGKVASLTSAGGAEREAQITAMKALRAELTAAIKASESALKMTQDAEMRTLRSDLGATITAAETSARVEREASIEAVVAKVSDMISANRALDEQTDATVTKNRGDLDAALANVASLNVQMTEQVEGRRNLEKTVERAVKQIEPKVEVMIAERIDAAAKRAANDIVAGEIKKAGYKPIASAPRSDSLDAAALARLTAGGGDSPAANRAPFDVVLPFSDKSTATKMNKFLAANGVIVNGESETDDSVVLMVGRFYELESAEAHRVDIRKRLGLNAMIKDRNGQAY